MKFDRDRRPTAGCCPFPIARDSFELWPAKRREFIVDFTKYQDGTPDHARATSST